MSSHREAPEISKDPVADSTDVYAFVSPDQPDAVTLIANYIPLQGPAGGPNFYEFGDDVLYEIHIDNDGDAKPDVTYQFRFTTRIRNQRTFLYNTGPIDSLDDADWNRPVRRFSRGSGPKASTWTSVRSSTSAHCGRSRTSTCCRSRPHPESMRPPS